MVERLKVTVKGIVQGVGFRPFVFRLAHDFGLTGSVKNTGESVVAEIQGSALSVQRFIVGLRTPPRIARIDSVETCRLDIIPGEREFVVSESDVMAAPLAIPPDIAMCEDCRREVRDPADRRYTYPFTNCTNCGPRFTIVTGTPYDRPRTSMTGFPMCDDCFREYHDPLDRRFHAQPVACATCGPRAFYVDAGAPGAIVDDRASWREQVEEALLAGKVIGIKGLGGFHVACDAGNPAAVEALRSRKERGRKPFAVMARSLADIKSEFSVSPDEERALLSPVAPIVILDNTRDLWPGVSGGTRTTGLYLPYTPLHELLFSGDLRFLVMTSFNLSGLPLVYRDQDALKELGGLVDGIVMHDRPIVRPCDDSVVRVIDGVPRYLRRSRGEVPRSILVAHDVPTRRVLAIGSEMKNTFCLQNGGSAVMSQHIGDLESIEGITRLRESVSDLEEMNNFMHDSIVVDAHPSYESSAFGREMAARERITLIEAQHHHAHMCSVMAENRLTGEVLGVIADSTGYGDDGAIWGCEFLYGGYRSFERVGHLMCTAMPGKKSVESPVFSAVAFLKQAGSSELEIRSCLRDAAVKEIDAALAMLASGFNCYMSSSLGRLLDGVSAILGFAHVNSYEGEAAVLLDDAARSSRGGIPYEYESRDGIIDVRPAMKAVVADLSRGIDREAIAGRFIATCGEALSRTAIELARQKNVDTVVVSGGSFQSRNLFVYCKNAMEAGGLHFFANALVPANDGGLALGQAAIGAYHPQEMA